jgi:ATP-dependent helicase/nuclease subunit A
VDVLMSTNQIIKASAGTGKTFQLALQFIKLCCQGESPDRILATTFTRKAAHEIRERIFLWLAEAVLCSKKKSDLLEHLGFSPNNKLNFNLQFQKVLANQNRLLITTMDSYFGLLGRMFHTELGLQESWRISEQDEEKELQEEALFKLLSASQEDANLQLICNRFFGSSIKSIRLNVLRDINELMSVYRGSSSEAWSCFKEALERAESVEDLIARFKECILPRTKAGEVAKLWSSAVIKIVAALEKKDFNSLLGEKICEAAHLNTTYARFPFSADLKALFDQAISLGLSSAYSELHEKNKSFYELIKAFTSFYEHSLLENNQLTFTDLKLLIGKLFKDQQKINFLDLFYRIDTKINHLLLDEFQDTSGIEFKIFAPLMDDLIAREDKTFFCVGDLKQAIYGWRGGVAEIFASLEDKWPVLKSSQQSLNLTRRCSKSVISFVNNLFNGLRNTKVLKEYPLVLEKWSNYFELHEAHSNSLGYVNFSLCSLEHDSSNGDEIYPPFIKALDTATEILNQRADLTVAILTRTNAAAVEITKLVDIKYPKLKINLSGGIKATDFKLTRVIVATLRFLLNPSNISYRYYLAKELKSEFFNFTDWRSNRSSDEFRAKLLKLILESGLNGLISNIVKATTADDYTPSLLAKINESANLFEHESKSLTGFLNFLLQMKIESFNSSNLSIMTIHSAKGLEFDVVLLPNLDENLINSYTSSRLFKKRESPLGDYDLVCVKPPKQLGKFCSQLGNLINHEEGESLSESLAVLYVALTRAKLALYLFSCDKCLKKATYGALVRECSPSDNWELGDKFILMKAPSKAEQLIAQESTHKEKILAENYLNNLPLLPALQEVKPVVSVWSSEINKNFRLAHLYNGVDWPTAKLGDDTFDLFRFFLPNRYENRQAAKLEVLRDRVFIVKIDERISRVKADRLVICRDSYNNIIYSELIVFSEKQSKSFERRVKKGFKKILDLKTIDIEVNYSC